MNFVEAISEVNGMSSNQLKVAIEDYKSIEASQQGTIRIVIVIMFNDLFRLSIEVL